VPDELDLPGVVPHALHAKLVQGELPISVGLGLGGDVAGGLVVVNLVDAVGSLGEPINVALHPVFAIGIEVDEDLGLQP
jgi:hypothetical protein